MLFKMQQQDLFLKKLEGKSAFTSDKAEIFKGKFEYIFILLFPFLSSVF